MEELASPQEIQSALETLFELQSEDPNKLSGILNKYGNPFAAWPLLKEPTEAFLRVFERSGPTQETESGTQKNINPKLKEMIEIFDKEIVEAKAGKVKASTAAKNYVDALIKKAREAKIILPETQAPPLNETTESPIIPARVCEAVSAAIQLPGLPEEKEMLFHALVSFSSEQPQKTVKELLPRAIAITEASRVLLVLEGALPQKTSFSELATNNFQRAAAGVLDVVIRDEDVKKSIINKILLAPLNAIVNHPEKLSRTTMQIMADRWGENFVNSNWFTQLRTSANHWMADQTGAARIRSGLFNVASDLATTIFRGPLSENIFTYMEEQRLLARQGFLITNFSPYHHTALARGKQLFSLKNRPPQKIGVIALVRNTILGIAGMIGIKVLGEGVLRGSNVLTSVGSQSSQALLSRAATLARNTIQNIRVAKQKTNIWFIIGGATFLFILIVLPMLGQDMINSSLATTSEGGMGNEAHVPPPDFGPINGSITDCVTSQGTNIEGTQTLTLTAGRAGQIQSISQKYPQLGCYSQVLQCPTTKINITAFAVQSGGLGGYAPSGMPGNIIFYPAFFAYGDYDFARTLAHEMMHEVEWLHSDIYDAFINGTTDGSFPKGYCGPLGTYTAGNENSYETMSEAAGLYMVGNPLLQQKCQSAYDFMKKLFSQCQQ